MWGDGDTEGLVQGDRQESSETRGGGESSWEPGGTPFGCLETALTEETVLGVSRRLLEAFSQGSLCGGLGRSWTWVLGGGFGFWFLWPQYTES